MTSSKQNMTSPSTLQRAVEAEGEAWAVDCANAVKKEGRPVTGGWPGTMTEARHRLVSSKARLSRCGASSDRQELEVLTRQIYNAARKAWLARVQPMSGE